MKTSLHPTVSGFALVLFLSACDNNAVSTSPQPAVDPSHRQISATLLATCPAFPANPSSRALRTNSDSVSPVVQVQINPVDSFSYQIYDTTGSLVAKGMLLILVPGADSASAPAKQPGLLWNGYDTSGNAVRSGHYFLFDMLKDSTGAAIQEDSSCIGILRAASN